MYIDPLYTQYTNEVIQKCHKLNPEFTQISLTTDLISDWGRGEPLPHVSWLCKSCFEYLVEFWSKWISPDAQIEFPPNGISPGESF